MEETRPDNQFKIPEHSLPYFYAKIEKLNKRASKLGCPLVTFTDLGTELVPEEILPDVRVFVKVHTIEVKGEAPVIAGWAFVGTIEHRGDDNILRTVPEQELPVEYRTVDVKCDHCQTRRNRKNTYVVRDEAGEYKQVGRQCLRDFLGHQSPEAIARHAEMLMDLMVSLRDDEDINWGNVPRHEWTFGTEFYLAWVAYFIEEHGWLSRSKAQEDERYGTPTANLALDQVLPSGGRRSRYEKKHELSDRHKEQAKEALDWCRNELAPTVTDQSNEYIYNLVTVCKHDDMTARDAGLVASLIATWKRRLEQEREQKAEAQKYAQSNFVGQVKERITRKLEILGIHSIESDWGGATHIHRMRDEEGNIFTWFAHTTPLNEGDWYEVTGTIKGHDTYKGINQTILTRCRTKEASSPTPAPQHTGTQNNDNGLNGRCEVGVGELTPENEQGG